MFIIINYKVFKSFCIYQVKQYDSLTIFVPERQPTALAEFWPAAFWRQQQQKRALARFCQNQNVCQNSGLGRRSTGHIRVVFTT